MTILVVVKVIESRLVFFYIFGFEWQLGFLFSLCEGASSKDVRRAPQETSYPASRSRSSCSSKWKWNLHKMRNTPLYLVLAGTVFSHLYFLLFPCLQLFYLWQWENHFHFLPLFCAYKIMEWIIWVTSLHEKKVEVNNNSDKKAEFVTTISYSCSSSLHLLLLLILLTSKAPSQLGCRPDPGLQPPARLNGGGKRK